MDRYLARTRLEIKRRAAVRLNPGQLQMTSSFRLPAGIVAIGALALLACESRAGAPRAAAPPPGRDSAGVAILADSLPEWPAGAGWVVADSPQVVLGGDAIEPAYSFAGIRGGVLFPGGGFAVGNASPPALRVYDAGGTIAVNLLRPGRRVGEFERVGWVRAYRGDSLLLYDNLNAELLVFDREGRYGRQFSIASPDPSVVPLPVAAFADGSLLSYERRVMDPDSLPNGIYQESLHYFRRDPGGRVVDTLGRFPGDQFFVARPGGSLAVVPLPFGRQPAVVPGDGRLHAATGERYEIRTYDEHGRLQRIIRVPRQGDSVTPAGIAAVRAERLADAARKGAAVERTLTAVYDSIPWPARESAVSALLLDSQGDLWAREHAGPGPSRWAVFDSAGRLLGRVTIPAGLTVLDVGADRILASRTDPSGQEFVEVHALRRK